MKKKENKSIRKAVYWIAKSYYEYLEYLEHLKNINEYKSEENEIITILYEKYINLIEDTFSYSVNEEYKELIWEYFYKSKKVKGYEEIIVRKEIDRWLYYFGKELGLLTVY